MARSGCTANNASVARIERSEIRGLASAGELRVSGRRSRVSLPLNAGYGRSIDLRSMMRDPGRPGSVGGGERVGANAYGLFRRPLGQDSLQRTPVHAEPPRRLRDIAPAELVDALNMLPAHSVGGHW